ncbi:MAG TPA: TlpA disulfide reductase family protein [Pyrinomonadaceae bacterium]|jgi:peroxiredoxin
MKSFYIKPFVTVPLILGVFLSFSIFLNIWKQHRLKSELNEAVKISNVSLPKSNLVNYKNNVNYFDDVEKGKTFLIFLSSKCDACKKELGMISDNLPKISNEYKVYGASIEDKSIVTDFVKENNIAFPVLIDSGAEIFRSLQLKYFPTKMIIENGVITKTWFGSSPSQETLLKELNLGEM